VEDCGLISPGAASKCVRLTGGNLYMQGGFQYYLYNTLFVRWCSGMTQALGHKGSAPIKTFIDQAIQ
jgi:hypothetical protein